MNLEKVRAWTGKRLMEWTKTTKPVGMSERIKACVLFTVEVVLPTLDGLPPPMTRRLNPKEVRARLLIDLLKVCMGEGMREKLDNLKGRSSKHRITHSLYRTYFHSKLNSKNYFQSKRNSKEVRRQAGRQPRQQTGRFSINIFRSDCY